MFNNRVSRFTGIVRFVRFRIISTYFFVNVACGYTRVQFFKVGGGFIICRSEAIFGAGLPYASSFKRNIILVLRQDVFQWEWSGNYITSTRSQDNFCTVFRQSTPINNVSQCQREGSQHFMAQDTRRSTLFRFIRASGTFGSSQYSRNVTRVKLRAVSKRLFRVDRYRNFKFRFVVVWNDDTIDVRGASVLENYSYFLRNLTSNRVRSISHTKEAKSIINVIASNSSQGSGVFFYSF